MKRGKMLGGKPRRRGGRLTNPSGIRSEADRVHPQLLLVTCIGFLVLGGVAGFTVAMDRQLRGGVLQQRAEAMQRPDWVAIEALPAYVPNSFITVVDPAFASEGAPGTRSGDNALARELVRQIHMLGDGIAGQARALVMAPVLEQRASNRDLLELYLNRVYLGRTGDYPVFGIHHAALEYFDKNAAELTLSEAATLAGLLLDPRIDNPEMQAGAVGARRNDVLRALLQLGAITEEEYVEAIRERLGFQPGLEDLPMSRRIPMPDDTAVIRLPPEYRPQPEPEGEEGTAGAAAS